MKRNVHSLHLIGLLILTSLLACVVHARAAGVFIPAPNRVDVVHDAVRGVLYISGGTNVLRYHMGSGTFLTPYQFPATSNLKGIDLSPDGNTLVVADRTGSPSHVWVYVINLLNDTVTMAPFPRAYAEDGTWAVAFGGDGAALITSTTMGSASVPFRRYDPATGSATVTPINQNSMVTASAYGDFMGLAHGNNSGGPVNRYDVFNRTFPKSAGTGWYNYEIGVSRDATQFAVPTYGGCFIFDGNLTWLRTVGTYAGPQPIGVVYHPADDVVFFAWAGTTEVRAYLTTTMTQVGAYDFQHSFALPGNWAFTQGRLRISRDGTLLFSTVNNGVRYVTLSGFNRPPIATPTTASGPQAAPLFLTVSGSDPDGNALSFVLAASPAHGSVSGAYPNVTYTPEAGFRGTDTFTFKVNDGKALSRAALVTLLITNQPPTLTAVATLNGALEDQPFGISHSALLSAADEADPNGDPISFRIEGVISGTLTKNGAAVVAGVTMLASGESLVWTPAANVNGAALPAFTVTASDGASSSGNPVEVAINVGPVNDIPAVEPRSIGLVEDSSVTFTLTGTDVDGDGLTFLVVNGPAYGTLTQQGANFTYTPAMNFSGVDIITYKASDGQAESAEATVVLSVAGENDAPVFGGQAVIDGAMEDTPFTLTHAALLAAATASDADGDALSFRVESILSGTLTKNGQPVTPGVTFVGPGESLLWTPPGDEFGVAYAIFTARLSDGMSLSAAAWPVTANVAPVNDIPTLNPLPTFGLSEDQIVTWPIDGISSGAANEAQTLTVSAVSSDPALLPNPVITYTSPATNAWMTLAPTPDASGACTVTVSVSDGIDTFSRSFPVTVQSVNDRPTINQVAAMILTEDPGEQVVTLTGITSGAPNEIQTLTVTATSGYTNVVPHPTIEYTSPDMTAVLRFTPLPNMYGAAPITVSVSDGLLTSNMIFQVIVNPVNDPPTIDPIPTVVINEDAGAQNVPLTGISAGPGPGENQNLTVSALSGNPALFPNPTVSYVNPNSGGTLTFTPVANAFGTTTVSVTVQELPGLSTVRTFSVVINPVNDAPTVGPRVLNLSEDSSATITLTGTDIDGDALTFLVGSVPAHGTVTQQGGNFTYTPAPNFNGSDSFTYKASDGQAESAEAIVAITVGAVNDAPVYTSQGTVPGATEDTPFTLTYAALLAAATVSEVDGDPILFRVESVLSGTLTKNGQSVSPGVTLVGPGEALSWTPPANEFGSAYGIFTARLSDGTLLSTNSWPVTVNLAAVNDIPTLNPIGNFSLNEDQNVTWPINGISSGAANETQTLTVSAESSDPALLPNPVITYTSPATNASITLAPTPNAFGACTVTVTVSDGIDTFSRSFSVTFQSVNDRPTINQVSGMILSEDPGEQVITLTGITAGAPNENQPLSVTAISGYTNVVPHPTIEYTSPNSTAVLRFTPLPNLYGAAPITVSVSDGLLTSNMIFQVIVNPVNDPPTVDAVPTLVINEDATQQTITLSGISAGPNENQNLSLSAVSSNSSIIPQPTVSYTSPNSTGTLTFTPVANAFGTATVSVTVQEVPGLSITRTFNVVVNPVNDPPTLNTIGNVSYKRKTPSTVNLSGITAGPNEMQTLVVTAVSSNPSLVPNPAVTYTSPNSTGSLLLTAPGNDTGTATITVTVNDGQSANNTVVRTFTVTVTK